MGRFLSRDLIGEHGGLNLYGLVANNPVNAVDIWGLWGSDVHKDKTIEWARELQIPYPEDAARRIGTADDAVDGGWTGFGTGWAPLVGSQKYHFNRNPNGVDSRFERFDFHFKKAKDLCHRYVDVPEDAADQLGIALHPIQDWVAHGDLNAGAFDTTKFHNMDSPQTDFGTNWKLPDRTDLDAVNGPEGRPAGPAMNRVSGGYHNHYRTEKEWAIFSTGPKRLNLTKTMTENRLKSFLEFVAQNGGCRCKKYFLGIESQPWWQ